MTGFVTNRDESCHEIQSQVLDLRLSRSDAQKVLSHPDIFEVISEDGMAEVPMPEGPVFLCGYDPDLIGCFILHKTSKISADCHVQVFPEHRDRSAMFGDAVIEWTWEHTDLLKLTAQIPVIYPNVRDFALARGFVIEGLNKASFVKHGELHDQWYMGIIK